MILHDFHSRILYDPITLTAIGLGVSAAASVGGAAAAFMNRPKAPSVPGAPPTPAPAQQPTGSPQGSTPTGQPSFLAAAAAPAAVQQGGKTLLGQ